MLTYFYRLVDLFIRSIEKYVNRLVGSTIFVCLLTTHCYRSVESFFFKVSSPIFVGQLKICL